MIAAGYALSELPQIVPRKYLAELGLRDQNDLQQLLFGGFEISQKAKLLQHIGCQVLCFIDEQDCTATSRVCGKQVPVQRVHE